MPQLRILGRAPGPLREKSGMEKPIVKEIDGGDKGPFPDDRLRPNRLLAELGPIRGEVWAIIPARSGSKGVPGKNVRRLGGHPLLAWSIRAALLSRRISRVLVSTDSEEYARLARDYGAETPFLRPAELAGDQALDAEFMLHALDWLAKHEGRQPAYLVHLRPTSPLRRPEVVDQAIDLFLADPRASSLCSAHEVSPPAKYFKLNPDGSFSAFIDEKYISLPRQQCPKAYAPNGYVDVLKSGQILAGPSIYGPRRLALVTEATPDIDTEEDWARLEAHPQVEELRPLFFDPPGQVART